MKLLPFLKFSRGQVRAGVQGVIALLMCLALTGCPDVYKEGHEPGGPFYQYQHTEWLGFIRFGSTPITPKSPRLQVQVNSSVPGESLPLSKTSSGPGVPRYGALVQSLPGNRPRTTYSVTGPSGTLTTMSATGFTENAAMGDLDNDGNSGDVAMTMQDDNNVTVVRLVGDTLQSPVQYSTGTNPMAVAIGDVNGDHFPDLITANRGNNFGGQFTPGSLSLLLGKGDGTFSAATTVIAGTGPGDVALGDFNGDGKLDLAVANGSNLDGPDVTNRSVIVRLGLGNGTFGPEIAVATAQRTVGLRVLDFNNDGYADIVTTGSLLLGHGDGTFAPPVNLAPGINPYLVKVEDVSGDGQPDIILGVSSPKLALVLIGKADGTVAAPQYYVLNDSAFAVAYYDVDGDGTSDLLFSDSDAPTLLPGRGDGTFQWVKAIRSIANLSDASSATGAAVADFTGDGIPDVIVANGGSSQDGTLSGNAATLLPGLGGGKLGNPQSIPGQPGVGVVTGDWNLDGKPDLAFVGSARSSSGTGGTSSALMIALNLGGGTFSPYNSMALSGAQSASPYLATASLNHDSAIDLLVGNLAVDHVSLFLGNGVGGFTEAAPVAIGTAPVVNALAVGDFNEDSHPDLVVSYDGDFLAYNGGMRIAFGNGNGTFQSATTLRDSIAAKGVAVGDFNRDGHLDLALATQTGFSWDVAIYLGHGDGSFAAPMPLGLGEDLVSGVIVVDFDQDGKLDLAVPFAGDALLLLRGLGDGTFARVMRAPIGGGRVIAADLNQDGRPDMLAPNGLLSLYINDLPELTFKYPLLAIKRALGKMTMTWPDFIPDFRLAETPDLGKPFTPSGRRASAQDGYFNLELKSDEAKASFFRLEPTQSIR